MTMTRHPADFVSLAFGLLFAATGLVLLTGGIETLSLEWVGPLAAVTLGGLLILAGRSGRTDSGDNAPEG
jgi:hypothetical protein